MTDDKKISGYLNGRLDQTTRDAFEAEMSSNPALAAEVAMARGMNTVFDQDDATASGRSSQGWARLEQEIAASKAPVAANNNRPVWRSLAQTAAAVVVAVGLWQMLVVPELSDTNGAGFTPVSADTAGPVLQIVFAETAELADVIAILSEVDGTIVDGPGAIGLFHVSFPDEAARDAALTVLRDRPALVQNVAPN